jgi:hypothetical protein
MAFRLDLSASFDYLDNLLPDFSRLPARTSFSLTVLFRSREIADVTDSNESDATVLAFLLWLRRRPS